MPKISSYFNPLSNKFHAWQDFTQLNVKHIVGTIILTAIAAIFSLGVLAVPVFRLLVGRFKKEEDSAVANISKINTFAISALSNPASIQSTPSPSINVPPDDLSHFKNVEESSIQEQSDDEDDLDALMEEAMDLDYPSDIEENTLELNAPSETTKEPFQVTKKISERTKACRNYLESLLSKENKQIIETPDDGDCFYAAFAIGLSKHLGKEITLQEMRKQVSEELNELHKKTDNNWVKKYLDKDRLGGVTYKDYRKYIHEDTAKSLKNGRIPIWGREQVDGVLLCHRYKVNLRIWGVGVYNEDPNAMNDPNNFYEATDDIYPPGPKYEKTIDIALYPGHFLGILPKA